MWLTRFQDRSSVSTKTKFGRSRTADAGGGAGCAAGEAVQPAATAGTATRRPTTALRSFPLL